MKIHAAALSTLLIATPVVAHDFWIQPSRFQVTRNVPLPITFQVGHGQSRDRWRNNHRIVALSDIFQGGRRDRRGDLRTGAADLVASFPTAGLHILAIHTNYAFSELPAGRFNSYAKEEGLAHIIALRQRSGRDTSVGRERYSRRAKSLIQVGAAAPANQAFVTRPVGLKLEIVPDRSPYALDASGQLPLHVLYKGRRLQNATVKLTNLAADERPVAVVVTDRLGRAQLRVPARGEWLVTVVWSELVKGDPKADYDTTFSSLTFGNGAADRRR